MIIADEASLKWQENFRVSPVHLLYYGLIADGRREPRRRVQGV